jgi:hypothetical protein
MNKIKNADSAANFLAKQVIGRFNIIGPASAHLLVAGYW